MASVVAFDPGKGGGAAVKHPDGVFTVHSWRSEHEHVELLRSLSGGYEAVVEDVPAFVSAATSNASSFKLGYNFGFILGSLRALSFPTNLVKPQVWQKGLIGLKPKMGYTARKRVLKDNAIRMYPDLKITNATADAVLILNWYLGL
jgi:hypothetical protein